MRNVWIFNHYATKLDEPSSRDFEIFKKVVERGNKVTIFASSFSHYKREIKYLSNQENWKVEDVEGIKFVWIRTFPYKKNNWRRFVNMISYSWRVYWIARKINEKPDVIIGTCVHPFAVLSAYLVSRNKKCRFFYMVRDLWPQSLVDIGYLNSLNPIFFFFRALEKFLFRRAEKIIIVLPYANSYIENLGIPKEKIFWIPNGVDFELFSHVKKYEGGNPDNFVFMYAGIHASYANLDIIIKAAKIISEKQKNIRFVLVGDGLEKPNLINLAEKLGVTNVEFRNMVSKSEVPKIFSEADAFISIIKEMPVLAKYGIASSKLNDYMASGRPIVFAVNAKNNPVEVSKSGITVPPGNAEALASACERIFLLSREERIDLGKNGLEYVKKNHDVVALAEKIEKLIN